MEDANRLPRQPAANTRELLKNTLGMAWPAVLESFFIALAGMIDVKMVSNLGSYAVAAVGLTHPAQIPGSGLLHRHQCGSVRPGRPTLGRKTAGGRQSGHAHRSGSIHPGLRRHQHPLCHPGRSHHRPVWLPAGHPCGSCDLFPHHHGRYPLLCGLHDHQRRPPWQRQHPHRHDHQRHLQCPEHLRQLSAHRRPLWLPRPGHRRCGHRHGLWHGGGLRHEPLLPAPSGRVRQPAPYPQD